MMREKHITDSLDILAGFELQATLQEQTQVFYDVIDTLCGFPKPQRKYDTCTASEKDLAIYIYVSNARNACKLGALRYDDTALAYHTAQVNLETALTLIQS